MGYELREGFGNAFINSFKEKDNQPDFTGDILDEGKVKRVAIWKKKTTKGDTFLGVALSEKEENPARETRNTTRGDFADMDDDLPF